MGITELHPLRFSVTSVVDRRQKWLSHFVLKTDVHVNTSKGRSAQMKCQCD